MDIEKIPKMPSKYICEICDFKCLKKSNYETHIMTPKHENNMKRYKKYVNDIEKQKSMDDHFQCTTCNKIYKFNSGLWRHKKTCKPDESGQKVSEDKEIIKMLIKENSEFKNLILEVCKNMSVSSITNNTNTNNSHNKTFNLQVFLNETCKDAMNISEFVESLQIQIADLENVGKVGYVDGIANIIVKNLKALDVSKRPVHCSDLKREVMYIKDENKWEKDNEDKDKLRKAIKHIAHKNIKMIPAWKELNPKYVLDEGKANDEYIQIVMKSMGGSDKAQDISYENKIISKLAKSVVIDKESGLITI